LSTHFSRGIAYSEAIDFGVADSLPRTLKCALHQSIVNPFLVQTIRSSAKSSYTRVNAAEEILPMKRSWNPIMWTGFGLVLVAMASYPFVFARYPITRDFPWATLLLIAVAFILLATGVTRAFRQPNAYRGKITGSILTGLAVLLVGFFLTGIFYLTRQVPASHGAPKVGEIAPDFTLPDSTGQSVTLTSLLNSPFAGDATSKTAAVALIFYRGYW
jgi:hypothetical protein